MIYAAFQRNRAIPEDVEDELQKHCGVLCTSLVNKHNKPEAADHALKDIMLQMQGRGIQPQDVVVIITGMLL